MTEIQANIEIAADAKHGVEGRAGYAESIAEEIASIIDQEVYISGGKVVVHDGQSRPYRFRAGESDE